MEHEAYGPLVEDKDIPLDVQLRLIKKRTERGMSPLHISRLMNLKERDVERVIETHGWVAERPVDEVENEEPVKTPSQLERERLAPIIRNLAEKGMSRQEIADVLGKTRDYVNETARRFQIPIQVTRNYKSVRPAKYRSESFYRDIRTKLDEGRTRASIAKELKVSGDTIYKCIRYFEEEGWE